MHPAKRSMPRRLKNKKKRQGKHASAQQLLMDLHSSATVVAIPRNAFAPDMTIVQLRYNDTNNNQFTNNLATYTSRRWRINDAYDPDPNLGSGSLGGFTEWAAFYNRFLVIRFEWDLVIINKEALPLQVVTAPTPSDLGQNYASIFDLQEEPFAQNGAVGMSGGQDRRSFRGGFDVHRMRGLGQSWFSDPQYSSATNTSPSTRYYFNVGAQALGGTFTGNGIAFTGRFIYHVVFFERKTLIQ